MSFQKDYLDDVMKKVAKKFSMDTGWKYKMFKLEEDIDNCFGVIISVTLTDKIDKKTKNLVLKIAPDNGMKEVHDFIYEKEIYVYEKLLQDFLELKTNIGDAKELFPECYFSAKKEILVLKDMRAEGYTIYKERFLDVEHVTVSLKTLAKYHALSLILRDTQRNKAENIEEYEILRPYDGNHPGVNYIKQCVCKNSQVFRDTPVYSKICDIINNFEETVQNSFTNTKFLVYGHGDFWKDNILFKYKDQKPIKGCILDFQTTRLMAAAQDVLHFIITGTNTEIRRENFKNFLSIYYDTLRKCLEGSLVLDLFIETDFEKDLKVLAPFCAAHAIFAFTWWYGIEDEYRNKMHRNFVPLSEDIKKERTNYVKTIIVDIVQHLEELGYL